ncbi:ExbD/TolR family protein [Parapusillimonas granuli]|uniref:Biopolymer transporter ExbD n=1 Tax=Parapusillimonas granuli TaxID=380911 RepID=A0A853FXV9_9BURK|nr:biopolymer transporter ExbD [Parapusillimonas granuli]MBB5217253.1 biopolymer transport protein ExbD [Parapusillimonas granuli]MEB2399267.1 biopolymer transporter ExbD [Alcaligenaceae bacterium]NYT50954.1 biopolymer transporter ExbD [Parapusillimonas granuli]
MNFRRRLPDDELEINLIPLIDVLLVILIFLAATTSFTRYQQMKVSLPEARADALAEPEALNIAISQEGLYALEGRLLPGTTAADIAQALAAAAEGRPDAVLVINADAHSTHESVLRVMEAARQAGISRVNFATRSPR